MHIGIWYLSVLLGLVTFLITCGQKLVLEQPTFDHRVFRNFIIYTWVIILIGLGANVLALNANYDYIPPFMHWEQHNVILVMFLYAVSVLPVWIQPIIMNKRKKK